MADALAALRKIAEDRPGRCSLRPRSRKPGNLVKIIGTWSVDLVAQMCILGKPKVVALRRLTHEELAAVGLRPTSAEGYDGRTRARLGLAPEAAAREAARRISEATGIPVVED